MSINHHLLAKATTDKILANFKSGLWSCCNNIGKDFYRVGTDSTFPSPDAAFYDDVEKLMVSFEFKPPTETKRGILTGLGQTVAYLNSSNLSYLIIPKKLEDYNIGEYMTKLFAEKISDKLPIGLVVYENDDPSSVTLVQNVDLLTKVDVFSPISSGRFWAKHQDLPIPLFHLILHCYYLKKIGQVSGDAFAYCWNTYLVPDQVLKTLTPAIVKDLNNDPIKTLSGAKNILFFEKKLNAVKKLSGIPRGKAVAKLREDADSTFVGDNNYNSTKKNFVTFIKHIGAIDSTGNLTEEGFKLYHLGLVNGPNSKLFHDYFLKTVLLTGHHLDLIFDLDVLCNKYRGQKTIKEVKTELLNDYETRGMIKRNPNRMAGGNTTVEFLKYEFILWNNLELTVDANGLPEISFNWKKITEICSLPDL